MGKLFCRLANLCIFTSQYGNEPGLKNLSNMTQSNYQIGQVVNYSNGGLSVYTGTIVKVLDNGQQLVIIDDEAGMQLFNAGIACGSCVHPSQIIN